MPERFYWLSAKYKSSESAKVAPAPPLLKVIGFYCVLAVPGAVAEHSREQQSRGDNKWQDWNGTAKQAHQIYQFTIGIVSPLHGGTGRDPSIHYHPPQPIIHNKYEEIVPWISIRENLLSRRGGFSNLYWFNSASSFFFVVVAVDSIQQFNFDGKSTQINQNSLVFFFPPSSSTRF